jgi:hypothetical protein
MEPNAVAEKKPRKVDTELLAALKTAEAKTEAAKLALIQCYNDWKYAMKCYGQHDWMYRAFHKICDALKELGMEVDRTL